MAIHTTSTSAARRRANCDAADARDDVDAAEADEDTGSSGTSATAVATLIIDSSTWLRMSTSFVLIFWLIDSNAS